IPVRGVGAGAAELLDPGVFVRRDGLRRELSADPVGLVGDDDRHAVTQGRKRGGDAAGPASDHRDIAAELARARRSEERRGERSEDGTASEAGVVTHRSSTMNRAKEAPLY